MGNSPGKVLILPQRVTAVVTATAAQDKENRGAQGPPRAPPGGPPGPPRGPKIGGNRRKIPPQGPWGPGGHF